MKQLFEIGQLVRSEEGNIWEVIGYSNGYYTLDCPIIFDWIPYTPMLAYMNHERVKPLFL